MHISIMKKVIFFLATVAFVVATPIVEPSAARSISSMAEDAIIRLRDQMPCGFPKAGIPPVAPYVVKHVDVNINTSTLVVVGTLDNFHMIGLNDFEVAEIKINVIKKSGIFRLHFQNVYVDTLHDFKLFLKKAGFTINMIGAGSAKFAVKDLEIWGTLKYSLSFKSNKVKLKSLDVRAHIGDVESDIQGVLGDGTINHKMNDILEEAVELVINENQDFISKTVESIALPMVNDVLNKFTLNEIVNIIGKEAVECEPPL